MKKQSLKRLSLNKHSISNFKASQISGGSEGDHADESGVVRPYPTDECPTNICPSTEWYCTVIITFTL